MIHALVATVPRRRASCTRLLVDLATQSRRPDAVELVLDGYGDAPAPPAPATLSVREWRTPLPSGPGGRWRVARELDHDAVLVVIDDDVVISGAPDLVAVLAAAVADGGAAAAMGVTRSGRPALWGQRCSEPLIAGVASALAVRVGDLEGLDSMAAVVRAQCGFDPLGDLGDDEALVSANLWRQGVTLRHVHVKGLRLAAGTQDVCQLRQRRARDKTWDRQRIAIREATGWPWPLRRGA